MLLYFYGIFGIRGFLLSVSPFLYLVYPHFLFILKKQKKMLITKDLKKVLRKIKKMVNEDREND